MLGGPGGLAAALQACKLRKTSTTTKANQDPNGGGSGGSSSNSSGYGSIGHKQGGGMSFNDATFCLLNRLTSQFGHFSLRLSDT